MASPGTGGGGSATGGGGGRGGGGGFGGGGRAGGSSFGGRAGGFGSPAGRGGVSVLSRGNGSKFAGAYSGSKEGGNFGIGAGKMSMGKESGFSQGISLAKAAGKIEAGPKGAKAAKLDTKHTVFSDGRTPGTKNNADKMTMIGRDRSETPRGRDASKFIKMDVIPSPKTEPLNAKQLLQSPEFRPQAQPKTDTTVRQQQILGEIRAAATGRQGSVDTRPTINTFGDKQPINPAVKIGESGPRLAAPEQQSAQPRVEAKTKSSVNPFLSKIENRLSHEDRIKSITGELKNIEKKVKASANQVKAGGVERGPIKGLEVLEDKVKGQEEIVTRKKAGFEIPNKEKKNINAVSTFLDVLKKRAKTQEAVTQKVKPDSGASVTYLSALKTRAGKKDAVEDAEDINARPVGLQENVSLKSKLLNAKVVSLLKRTSKSAVIAPSEVRPEPLTITHNDQPQNVIELRQTASQLATEFASQSVNQSDRAQTIDNIRALTQRAAVVSASIVDAEQAAGTPLGQPVEQQVRRGQPVETNNDQGELPKLHSSENGKPNESLIKPASKSVDQSALAVRVEEGVRRVYEVAKTDDPDEVVSAFDVAQRMNIRTREATSEAIKESKLDIDDGSFDPTVSNISRAGAIQKSRAAMIIRNIARQTPPASDRNGEGISKTDYDRVFGRGEHVIYQAAA